MPTIASPETPARLVRLFRNGVNQALRIPKEFELPGKEAELRQVGNTLIITPVAPPKATLAQLLSSWAAIEDEFPNMDEGLLPLDDIDLGCTLVTADAEFDRVPGLRVENWAAGSNSTYK